MLENTQEFGTVLNDQLFDLLYVDDGTLEEIKAIIKQGADINARNEDGETVFQSAAGNFNDTLSFEIIEYLVKEAGADIASYDDDFCFLLHDVALLGDIPRLALFLKLGASPNQIDPETGFSLIEDLEDYLADPEGHVDTEAGDQPDFVELERSIVYLKENGAKPLAELFTKKVEEFIAVGIQYPNLLVTKYGQVKMEDIKSDLATIQKLHKLKDLAQSFFDLTDEEQQKNLYEEQIAPLENEIKDCLEALYYEDEVVIL
jgi:ankyrin repeat protein